MKINISSGEDMRFDYEPSTHHTYDSFKLRQETRMRRAAFEQANTIEGSVIEKPTPLLLPCCPAEPEYPVYDEAPGG